MLVISLKNINVYIFLKLFAHVSDLIFKSCQLGVNYFPVSYIKTFLLTFY